MEKTTKLRDDLDGFRFNWDSDWRLISDGRIITDKNDPIFEEYSYTNEPCWGGGCPHIIADDDKQIILVSEYDGATWLSSLEKDIAIYAKEGVPSFGSG